MDHIRKKHGRLILIKKYGWILTVISILIALSTFYFNNRPKIVIEEVLHRGDNMVVKLKNDGGQAAKSIAIYTDKKMSNGEIIDIGVTKFEHLSSDKTIDVIINPPISEFQEQNKAFIGYVCIEYKWGFVNYKSQTTSIILSKNLQPYVYTFNKKWLCEGKGPKSYK